MNAAIAAVVAAVVGGLLALGGTFLAQRNARAMHDRRRRESIADRIYAGRLDAYVGFLVSAQAAQTAATTIVRLKKTFGDNYETYDADLANKLRVVQLAGPGDVYERAREMTKAVWDFRDTLADTQTLIVYDRDEDSEYQALRRPYLAARDAFVSAAQAVLSVDHFPAA